jgi:hypothetical protein
LIDMVDMEGLPNAADFPLSVASIGALVPWLAWPEHGFSSNAPAAYELLAVAGFRGCVHRRSNSDAALAHPRRLPADCLFRRIIHHANRYSTETGNLPASGNL